MKTRKIDTFFLTSMALFTAILIIMAFTPLGALPISPGIVATLAQIPVVIVAIVFGKKSGMFLGGMFGLLSMIVFSTMYAASPSAYIFSPLVSFQLGGSFWMGIYLAVSSVIICFVPRILIGLTAAVSFSYFSKRGKENTGVLLAGIVGALTNTIFVLGLFSLLFGIPYACGVETMRIGKTMLELIAVTALLNGVLEAAVTAAASVAVAKPMLLFLRHR